MTFAVEATFEVSNNELLAELRKLVTESKSAEREIKQLGDAANDSSRDLDKMGNEAKDTSRQLDRMSRTATTGAQKMGVGFRALRSAFLTVTVAATAFYAAVGAATALFVGAASTTEQYRLRMNALLGSTAEGGRLFKEMTEFASKVPFELEEIMGAATQLSGILEGGVADIVEWMPRIADLAAVSGLGIQTTTEQISRMLSAGAGAADLFRDRGISAMLGFTAKTEYSVEQTKQKLEEFFGDMANTVNGSAQEMAQTWEGIGSMISDKWFQIRDTIANAGLFEFVKELARGFDEGMGDALDESKEKGAEWAGVMIEALSQVIVFGGHVIDTLQTLVAGIYGILSAAELAWAGLMTIEQSMTLGLLDNSAAIDAVYERIAARQETVAGMTKNYSDAAKTWVENAKANAAANMAAAKAANANATAHTALATSTGTVTKLTKEQTAALNADIKALLERRAATEGALDSVIAATRTEIESIEQIRDERIAAIEEAEEAGIVSAESAAELRTRVEAEFNDERVKLAEEANGEILDLTISLEELKKELALETLRGVNTAFVDFYGTILRNGKLSFGSLWDSFKELAFSAISQVLAAMTVNGILGLFGLGGGVSIGGGIAVGGGAPALGGGLAALGAKLGITGATAATATGLGTAAATGAAAGSLGPIFAGQALGGGAIGAGPLAAAGHPGFAAVGGVQVGNAAAGGAASGAGAAAAFWPAAATIVGFAIADKLLMGGGPTAEELLGTAAGQAGLFGQSQGVIGLQGSGFADYATAQGAQSKEIEGLGFSISNFGRGEDDLKSLHELRAEFEKIKALMPEIQASATAAFEAMDATDIAAALEDGVVKADELGGAFAGLGEISAEEMLKLSDAVNNGSIRIEALAGEVKFTQAELALMAKLGIDVGQGIKDGAVLAGGGINALGTAVSDVMSGIIQDANAAANAVAAVGNASGATLVAPQNKAGGGVITQPGAIVKVSELETEAVVPAPGGAIPVELRGDALGGGQTDGRLLAEIRKMREALDDFTAQLRFA